MSVGAGMEAGEKQVGFVSMTAAQMAEALINLLRELCRRHTERYSESVEKSMRMLSRHISSGGLIHQSVIDEGDADVFASALKCVHVPYMRFLVRHDGGSGQAVFLTRSGAGDHADKELPNDDPSLERAWAMFVRQKMGKGIQVDVRKCNDDIEREL